MTCLYIVWQKVAAVGNFVNKEMEKVSSYRDM